MKKTIEGPNEDRHEKSAEKSKMDKTLMKKMDINGDEERWNELSWPSEPLNCCRVQALGQQATHVQGRQWNCTTRALQRRAHGLNTGQRTKHKEMSWWERWIQNTNRNCEQRKHCEDNERTDKCIDLGNDEDLSGCHLGCGCNHDIDDESEDPTHCIGCCPHKHLMLQRTETGTNTKTRNCWHGTEMTRK